MAKSSDVNRDTTANSGAECMFRFKATLVAAGWVVKASSDGTTYNATGDQISTPDTAVGGMNRNNAWFRIQDPGGVREWCIQRTTSAVLWRVKWSALDKFTGGTPSATVVPSATDERVGIGSGTDASPVGASTFGTAGTYRNHVIAQSTPEGGVYGVWQFCTVNGTGAPGAGCITCEPLTVGTYPSADPDPCVVFMTNGSGAFFQASTVGFGWYQMNLPGETWIGYPIGSIFGNAVMIGGTGFVGSNPYTNNDDAFPIPFGRSSTVAQPGWKGYSRYLRLKGSNRAYPDTSNLATDAYVYFNSLLIPWPEGITPLT